MTKKLLVLALFSCTLTLGQMTPTISAQALPSVSGDRSGSPSLPSATADGESNQASPTTPKLRQAMTAVELKSTAASDSTTEEEANTRAAHSSPGIRPLASRSDFEAFVEEASGHPVEVYGRNLFEEVPSTFAPLEHIPVPANYAIGPGDELLIRVWGKIDLEARVTVDRNGQIALAKVGTLNVAGLRYEQLEGYLRTAMGSLYKGFELNVALGKLRSIQILLLGSARRPGQYTVGSLSTLVDALFASGGPSSTGTMRHIQLRREGRIVVDFDLYDLQQKGDQTHDVPLLAGDEIYIPPVGPQVAIVGNVNQPAIFELRGETTIASAVEGAGGLTNLAATARVLLERIEDHKLRRVDEFALDVRGLQRTLRDGDLLRISPISPQFENAVTILGNVASPGRFPWHEGMRVSDLVPSRGFLLTSDHWNRQNHLADERHTDMMTEIALSNAEINWDYAAIERLDEHDLSTRLIAFNLGRAIDNAASSDNQLLKVGDVITIFSRKDLPLPLEKHSTFVRIGGEVNAPGVYRVNPGDSLRGAVALAGGLTAHSYLYASQLARISTRQIQEGQLKLSIGRLEKELLSHYANSGHAENVNAAPADDARGSDQQAQLSLQRALIAQLSSTQPTGRVVLGIKPDAKTAEEIPDFPLEDGDSFYIPPRLGTIQVAGEVYNENAFRYEIRKPLYQYLDDSGGPTRLADVKRIFLIRADGTVIGRQSHGRHWPNNFEKVVLMPGDAIIVPPKIKTPGVLMEEFSKITQILSQTAMTGAVLSLIQ